MNASIAALAYLAAGVLFILSLRGLSSPVTSRRGNTLGMVGMALAVGVTLLTLGTSGALDPLTLVLIAGGMMAYAAIYLIEGLGLWFDRPWAEWLTVIATALFIPLELEHLIHKPSFGIAITLVLNLAVVGYLAWRIRNRIHNGRHPRQVGEIASPHQVESSDPSAESER